MKNININTNFLKAALFIYSAAVVTLTVMAQVNFLSPVVAQDRPGGNLSAGQNCNPSEGAFACDGPNNPLECRVCHSTVPGKVFERENQPTCMHGTNVSAQNQACGALIDEPDNGGGGTPIGDVGSGTCSTGRYDVFQCNRCNLNGAGCADILIANDVDSATAQTYLDGTPVGTVRQADCDGQGTAWGSRFNCPTGGTTTGNTTGATTGTTTGTNNAGQISCPGGLPVAWCVTFTCPNGDTNGDQQCTMADAGASEVYGDGTNCGPPFSCGQTDFYYGDRGDWDSFCGYTNYNLSNCTGGTTTSTTSTTSTTTPSQAICNQACGGTSGIVCVSGLQCVDIDAGPVETLRCRDPRFLESATCSAVLNPGIDVNKVAVNGTTFTVGSSVQFQVTITNTGQTTLTDVVFSDGYNPTYLDFVSISGQKTGTGLMSLGGVANVNEQTGLIQIINLAAANALGPLAPGQTYTLNFVFIARAPLPMGTDNTCNLAVSTANNGGVQDSGQACVDINTVNTDL